MNFTQKSHIYKKEHIHREFVLNANEMCMGYGRDKTEQNLLQDNEFIVGSWVLNIMSQNVGTRIYIVYLISDKEMDPANENSKFNGIYFKFLNLSQLKHLSL